MLEYAPESDEGLSSFVNLCIVEVKAKGGIRVEWRTRDFFKSQRKWQTKMRRRLSWAKRNGKSSSGWRFIPVVIIGAGCPRTCWQRRWPTLWDHVLWVPLPPNILVIYSGVWCPAIINVSFGRWICSVIKQILKALILRKILSLFKDFKDF